MIGVCIVTYNQEKYIAQAIESVLMQVDCGHKVVAYVGEDNSTDRTGEICETYARRVNDGMSREKSLLNEPHCVLNDGGRFEIKVIHNKKNLGLVGNTMNLLDIMRKDGCEYIAMLDGDDYWCDDHKLQKQMAYMEAHQEYGLVHTCIDLLYPHKLVRDNRTSMPVGDVSGTIFNYPIGNCSVVFKTKLLDLIDFDDFQQHGFMSCDFIMYLIFSCYTQFGFQADHTAVWRRGHDSVSNTNDMEKQIRYVQNDLAMWRYAAQKFPDRWHATDEEVEDYLHYRTFAIAFRYGDRKRALEEAKKMGDRFQKSNKWKILVAHSAVLSAIWRFYKERQHH